MKHVGKYFSDDANLARERRRHRGARAEVVCPVSFGMLHLFVAGDNLIDQD